MKTFLFLFLSMVSVAFCATYTCRQNLDVERDGRFAGSIEDACVNYATDLTAVKAAISAKLSAIANGTKPVEGSEYLSRIDALSITIPDADRKKITDAKAAQDFPKP